MNTDLGIDISSANLTYCACRGSRPAIIYKGAAEVASTFVPRYRTYVMFSGHALTHLDLPWPLLETIDGIDDENIKHFPPPNEFVRLAEEKYLSVRTDDAIILDITDKRDVLEKFINMEFLKSDIPPFSFEDLMRKLEVTWDELSQLLPNVSLKGKILILKTGWERLAKREMDISNPYFEFRHPYLVHPYISLETLRQLLALEIEGLGTDSYCLENPAYYCSNRSIPDYAANYVADFDKKDFLPILVTMLTEFKLYLKNLRNLDRDELRTGLREFILGKVTTIPIDFGDRDMCLAKVFFKREG